MKNFLALETSLEKGCLGLFQVSKGLLTPLVVKEWKTSFKEKGKIQHSDKLPLEIKESLEEAQLTLKDLHFLAVGIGPGRFTGVRTSVNVIRSLAFSLKIPTYPVDTLRVIAKPFLKEKDSVCVAFNAFKNTVYFTEYYKKEKIKNVTVMDFNSWLDYMIQNKKTFCLGDVKNFYSLPEELTKQCEFLESFPNIEDMARIVCDEFQSEKLKPWFSLEPLYLRSISEKG